MNFLTFLVISYDSVSNGKCKGYPITYVCNHRPIGSGNIISMSDYITLNSMTGDVLGRY